MAKASDCGSEDRGFESLHPPHFFLSLERHWILGCRQAVRHQTLTLALAGSSPAIPATPEQSMLCPGSFYAQPLSFLLFVSIFDPLAQLAEQLPFKQWVRGSNPRRVTRKQSNPQGGLGCFLFMQGGDSNGSIATVRWTVASASAHTGRSRWFASGKTQANPRREVRLRARACL